MKKNLIGLLAIAGVALTWCNNSTIKVKILQAKTKKSTYLKAKNLTYKQTKKRSF